MRYALAFAILSLSSLASSSSNEPSSFLPPPTKTVPFVPPRQGFQEFGSMATTDCGDIQRANDQLPIEEGTRTCGSPSRLQRRQSSSTSCPDQYSNCFGVGAPGLCCQPSSVCSPDMAGNVACCPVGAACTGTISAVGTASKASTSTSTSSSSTLPTSATSSSTSGGFTISSAGPTTTGGLVISASGGSVTFSTFPGFELISAVAGASNAIWDGIWETANWALWENNS